MEIGTKDFTMYMKPSGEFVIVYPSLWNKIINKIKYHLNIGWTHIKLTRE